MQMAFGSHLWRGKKIKMIDIRQAIVATLFCALIGNLSGGDKIKVDVRQSDAAIRQQLLRLTPRGSSIDEVHRFLENRLYRDREFSRIAGWPVRVSGGSMSVALGHYHDPRTVSEVFLPFATIVQAIWQFDKRNRLRDIQVRRGLDAL